MGQNLTNSLVFPRPKDGGCKYPFNSPCLIWLPPSPAHRVHRDTKRKPSASCCIPCLYFVPKSPTHLILYTHGNSVDLGNSSLFSDLRDASERLRVAIAAPEYPGYGYHPAQSASAAALDATVRSVFDFFAGEGVLPGRVILWGHSLGSGPTLVLARALGRTPGARVARATTKRGTSDRAILVPMFPPPMGVPLEKNDSFAKIPRSSSDDRARKELRSISTRRRGYDESHSGVLGGVIIQGAFTSLQDAIRDLSAPIVTPFFANLWDNQELLRGLDSSIPVLIAHGRDDNTVPPAHSKRLLYAAAARRRARVLLHGFGHCPPLSALTPFLEDFFGLGPQVEPTAAKNVKESKILTARRGVEAVREMGRILQRIAADAQLKRIPMRVYDEFLGRT